ncbi:hypothetical protein GOV14_01740 [Candidatus Pacearchaeota archaeon]|nr:hypothetical protein [Candidatus Pacearchaeota archaeon]
MTKVKFKFDENIDLKNIWETCNSSVLWHDFQQYLPENMVAAAHGKEFTEAKKEMRKILKSYYNSGNMDIFSNALNDSWKLVEDKYVKRLEQVTKKPLTFDQIAGYITTTYRCPYYPDEKNPSFMVSTKISLQGNQVIAGHEIMHIHFHKHHWDGIEEKLGCDKTGDLKEALTVLLNLEFKDILFGHDRGYDCHQELRKYLAQEWEKNKDFDVLLEKGTEYLEVV